MTFFAPGTNQNYATAFDNWWFNRSGQGPAPAPQSFGPKAVASSPRGRQASPFGDVTPEAAAAGQGEPPHVAPQFRPGMAQPAPLPPYGTPYRPPVTPTTPVNVQAPTHQFSPTVPQAPQAPAIQQPRYYPPALNRSSSPQPYQSQQYGWGNPPSSPMLNQPQRQVDPRWNDVIANPRRYDPQTVAQASQETGKTPIDPWTNKPMEVMTTQQIVDRDNAWQDDAAQLARDNDALLNRLASENGITNAQELADLRFDIARSGWTGGNITSQARLQGERARRRAIDSIDWSKIGSRSRQEAEMLRQQQEEMARQNAAMDEVISRMTARPTVSAANRPSRWPGQSQWR